MRFIIRKKAAEEWQTFSITDYWLTMNGVYRGAEKCTLEEQKIEEQERREGKLEKGQVLFL